MSTGAIIGIIIVVIVVVAAVVLTTAELRRARLRRQFGPEYDRLVEQLGSRRKADAALAERVRRVQALPIHELSAEQQAAYSGDWTAVQERFVDAPAQAVTAADALIWNAMRDRGYPADDRNVSMDALTVHHGRALEGYRQTRDLKPESASTEQLRETMIRYRALFEDLTGLRNGQDEPGRDRVAAIHDRAAGTATDGTVPDGTATDGTVPDGTVPDSTVPDSTVPDSTVPDGTAETADRAADTPR